MSPTATLPAKPGRAVTIALTAGLLIATALVVLLALQVRTLREEQRWLVKRASEPYVGMYVPRVRLRSIAGTPHVLGQPRDDSQIAFFFTTTCPYCRRSLPMIRQVATHLDAISGGRAEMVGIAYDSIDAARNYADEHALPFPVIASTDQRTSMLFRARTVPVILVIGRDGRVKHSHVGALDSREGLNAILSAARSKDVSAGTLTQEKRQ